MRIALAQINTTVGDLAGNRDLILSAYNDAVGRGADLVVFPELTIIGYPPRDLLEDPDFIRRAVAMNQEVAAGIGAATAIVGGITPNAGEGKPLFNSALLMREGRIVQTISKTLLPTYDVFDESRWFEPAPAVEPVNMNGRWIGVTICEDIWNDPTYLGRQLYHQDPAGELSRLGVELIVNLSASPFHSGKKWIRRQIIEELAAASGVPVLYCNLVGGNDDLIFAGRSMACSPRAGVTTMAKGFEPDILMVETDALPTVGVEMMPREEEEILDALILGLRDYFAKTGSKQAVLGLSGGIDSALTAAIAVLALGPENVLGVIMPSPHSSDHSVEDAERLAAALGIVTRTIPIGGVMKGYDAALTETFAGTAPGIAEENIQARIRGNLLMAISNKFRHLVLATGNKSELAMGYCTLYGDMAGGLAVISDLPKTMVYAVAHEANKRILAIPERSFTKAPSAELKPGQKDSDSLPPYDVLDPILRAFVEEGLTVEQTVTATGAPEALVREVVRRMMSNEYKRRQGPMGLKVTSRAFGTGRRWPIAHRWIP
jgi:NAD+ synthase/NAD+ synthase (glutamine-hydrolysing)